MSTLFLQNPAWHALNSGNKNLGQVSDGVAWFDPQVSPFVALAEPRPALLTTLYDSIPYSGTFILVTGTEVEIPAPWENGLNVPGFQMVYEGDYPAPPVAPPGLISLGQAHVPQMLALTALTQPGPFLPKTIEFGHYEGILEGNELLAMAGQRLNPAGFAEISAVCTHPDHLGKGHARLLMRRQIERIHAAGQVPFLHVRQDNRRAIEVYDSLGFTTRGKMFFYILTKR